MNEGKFKEIFKRHPKNPILTAADWPYPVNTVFNPGATLFQGKTLLLARCEARSGYSHLTKAVSADGAGDWQIDGGPTLAPDPKNHPEERWGIEDPRITWLAELGKWAVIYTAYSRGGPLVAMALTDDFANFDRLGPDYAAARTKTPQFFRAGSRKSGRCSTGRRAPTMARRDIYGWPIRTT